MTGLPGPLSDPDAEAAAALVHACVTVLGWEFSYRGLPLTGDDAVHLVSGDPYAELMTVCRRFDTVTCPYGLGRLAEARLTRRGAVVPSFRTGLDSVTFLVLPDTGYRAARDRVTVASGDGGWIIPPPGAGRRWHISPLTDTATARPLTGGQILHEVLGHAR